MSNKLCKIANIQAILIFIVISSHFHFKFITVHKNDVIPSGIEGQYFYKIRYKYAVGSKKPSSSTRDFCENMMRLSRTKKDMI